MDSAVRTYVIMLTNPWKSVVERTVAKSTKSPILSSIRYIIPIQCTIHCTCTVCWTGVLLIPCNYSLYSSQCHRHSLFLPSLALFGPSFCIAHHHGNNQVLKFKYIRVHRQTRFHFQRYIKFTSQGGSPSYGSSFVFSMCVAAFAQSSRGRASVLVWCLLVLSCCLLFRFPRVKWVHNALFNSISCIISIQSRLHVPMLRNVGRAHPVIGPSSDPPFCDRSFGASLHFKTFSFA